MISQHNRLNRTWQTTLSLLAHAALLVVASLVPYVLGHKFAFSADVAGVAVGVVAWAVLAVTEERIQSSPPATRIADDTPWRGYALHALWLVLPMSAWDASLGWGTLAAGIPLLLAGMTLRAWSLWTLGPLFTWTAGVTEGHRVIRHGPYRFFKHPNYLGSVVFAAGIVLTAGSLVGWICVALLGVSVFIAARHEAAFLKQNLPDY